MKLHGTIDRHKLVKYLVKEYAHHRKMMQQVGQGGYVDESMSYFIEAETYRVLICKIRDNVIQEIE